MSDAGAARTRRSPRPIRRAAAKRVRDGVSPESEDASNFSRVSSPKKTRTKGSRSTDKHEPTYRVAVDLGTTFTTVATHSAIWEQDHVETIDTFPGARKLGRLGIQQPTELWYPHNEAARVRFGHEVTRLLETSKSKQDRANYSNEGRVVKPKLLLDTRNYVSDAKADLLKVLDQLKATGYIAKHEEVLTDFLIHLFIHTKAYLELHYGLNETSSGICFASAAPAKQLT